MKLAPNDLVISNVETSTPAILFHIAQDHVVFAELLEVAPSPITCQFRPDCAQESSIRDIVCWPMS